MGRPARPQAHDDGRRLAEWTRERGIGSPHGHGKPELMDDLRFRRAWFAARRVSWRCVRYIVCHARAGTSARARERHDADHLVAIRYPLARPCRQPDCITRARAARRYSEHTWRMARTAERWNAPSHQYPRV